MTTWKQEAKVVGIPADAAEQGWSIGLSQDGNTAIVGGPSDNSDQGAAWVFIRHGNDWPQQDKLGLLRPNSKQGYAVALSGDGKTAIVGGPEDGVSGAAWVYVVRDGAWNPQGEPLDPDDAGKGAYFGNAASLSNDGNTAIVGGMLDDNSKGAAWVFTRKFKQNGDFLIWEQVKKLVVGETAEETFTLGSAVAISANGDTAIVGAPGYGGDVGAAFVFSRGDGKWTQQGIKLVGSGSVGQSQQGTSVAISGDGNTAIVGGPNDNSYIGAAWVYSRNSSG
jgi:hypothetical protein